LVRRYAYLWTTKAIFVNVSFSRARQAATGREFHFTAREEQPLPTVGATAMAAIQSMARE